MEADQIKKAQVLSSQQNKAEAERKRSNAVAGYSNPSNVTKGPMKVSFKERVSITMRDTIKQRNYNRVFALYFYSKKKYQRRKNAWYPARVLTN